MKKKKKIVNIMLESPADTGSAVFYIYKEYNRTHKDTAELKPDYSITAINLIKGI